MKKEIKYRRNVMCLNYPQIIAHHHSSSWENCLPPKRSLVPKRVGIAETEGPGFRKQGSKFQKLQAPHFPCVLCCVLQPQRIPGRSLGLSLSWRDTWWPYVQGLLQGHPHVDTPFMGGAAFAQDISWSSVPDVRWAWSVRLKKDTAPAFKKFRNCWGEK